MGTGGDVGDRDARVLAWLTAPEGASARPVLDATFAELPRIRQDAWRPWTPLVDALSRPTSLELPRWAWIALVLLLLLAISISTLTIAGRLRPFLDRLSALPALPAEMVAVACPQAFSAAGQVQCSMATVPERHERPDGPDVRVFVATFPAGTDRAVAGAAPIVVPITFDPYGEKTMLDLATSAQETGRQVIGVMPRGTGSGEPPLDCPEIASIQMPTAPASIADPAWRTSLADAVRSCRDRLTASGIDTEAYGLAEQAADLESIREGLGVNRWIVRTAGDDSRLALELLRRYPDHVQGAILVQPSFPGEDPAQVTAEAVPASLDALASMCAADPFCAGTYRPPDEAYAAAMRGGDAATVARAVRSAMATTGAVATIPSRLNQLGIGGTTWPADQAASHRWCLGFRLACSNEFGWIGGGDIASVCQGRALPPDPNAGTTETTVDIDVPALTGLVAADPWDVICLAWAGDHRDASTMRPVSSDVRVVVIAARLDPFHSIAAITTGMHDLSHGMLVTIPWAPEGIGGRCLYADDAAWLDDQSADLPAGCTQVDAPRFADAP
jgi:pimeloyl-ACP methyl ester carboxylesterase